MAGIYPRQGFDSFLGNNTPHFYRAPRCETEVLLEGALSQALFLEVTAEKADQLCSTS